MRVRASEPPNSSSACPLGAPRRRVRRLYGLSVCRRCCWRGCRSTLVPGRVRPPAPPPSLFRRRATGSEGALLLPRPVHRGALVEEGRLTLLSSFTEPRGSTRRGRLAPAAGSSATGVRLGCLPQPRRDGVASPATPRPSPGRSSRRRMGYRAFACRAKACPLLGLTCARRFPLCGGRPSRSRLRAALVIPAPSAVVST